MTSCPAWCTEAGDHDQHRAVTTAARGRVAVAVTLDDTEREDGWGAQVSVRAGGALPLLVDVQDARALAAALLAGADAVEAHPTTLVLPLRAHLTSV
ncbi:MAG: hypothetical protein R2737_10315 [Candidatus Nanopelagicales bacterium]